MLDACIVTKCLLFSLLQLQEYLTTALSSDISGHVFACTYISSVQRFEESEVQFLLYIQLFSWSLTHPNSSIKTKRDTVMADYEKHGTHEFIHNFYFMDPP